jgi:hypothetical protein
MKHFNKSLKPALYTPPVDLLLAMGDARKTMSKWPDYLGPGISSEHIPELIRMATDESLMWADSESEEVWAPVHARRALGQLHATEAIESLLSLLADDDDDWIGEEVPVILALIGPMSAGPASKYLQDKRKGADARITASVCLEKIALRHREARDTCIAALSQALEGFKNNDPDLNGFIISSLCELNADEALPLIERAFKADTVEEMIVGDWDEVRREFGLPPERTPSQMLAQAAQGKTSPIQPPPRYNRFVSRTQQMKPRKK